MTMALQCVEIAPVGAHRATVIWLHGLGADGHDFEAFVPELQLPPALGLRFVFPHAPVRPITLNGGMPMRGWYDIAEISPRAGEDEAGIRGSEAQLRALIATEIARGIPPERILLAGFSQGAAMVLHTGLRYPQRLCGILALSGYLPLPERLAAERADANNDVPLFIAHGDDDAIVPLPLGEMTQARLQELHYASEFRVYPMGHGLCPQEARDIRAGLLRRCEE